MNEIGRWLISLGVLLLVLGSLFLLAGKIGLPLGRLPGDFAWRGKHSSVYFPLATSLLLSLFLSLAFYILSRLRR